MNDAVNGITIIHDKDIHRLLLEEVSTEDSGVYAVIARNAAGDQVESNCSVLIRIKEWFILKKITNTSDLM